MSGARQADVQLLRQEATARRVRLLPEETDERVAMGRRPSPRTLLRWDQPTGTVVAVWMVRSGDRWPVGEG